MPERFKYAHLFKGNPFAGKNPAEMFSLLHWGNKVNRTMSIEAPEPLIMLGMTAVIVLKDGRQLHFSNGEAFLAVGHETNELYVIPRINDQPMKMIPSFGRGFSRVGRVTATHYLSTKGGRREHYYYHDHEPPYPLLYVHASGVGYIRAVDNKGSPSYAVGKEGIVG